MFFSNEKKYNFLFVIFLCFYFTYLYIVVNQNYIFNENWNALYNIENFKRFNEQKINVIKFIFENPLYFVTNKYAFAQGRFFGFLNGNITDIIINSLRGAIAVRFFGLVSIFLFFLILFRFTKKYLNNNENLIFIILISTLPFFSYKILNGAFWLINLFFAINLYISIFLFNTIKRIRLFDNSTYVYIILWFFYFIYNLSFFYWFPTLGFLIIIPSSIAILLLEDRKLILKYCIFVVVFFVITIVCYLIILDYYQKYLLTTQHSWLVETLPKHYNYNIFNNFNLSKIFFIIPIKFNELLKLVSLNFSLWFFINDNVIRNLAVFLFIFIFINFIIFEKNKTKFILLSIVIGLYTLPLMIKSHEASLLRDNLFFNIILVLIIVKYIFTLKSRFKIKNFNVYLSIFLIIIFYQNYNFTWTGLVKPNVNQIELTKKQILEQKNKPYDEIVFYWEPFKAENRIYDIANVAGINFHGNVPNIIREACRNICEKHIDLNWGVIWNNQLKTKHIYGDNKSYEFKNFNIDNKNYTVNDKNWHIFKKQLKTEWPNKLFIFFDKDYFKKLFNES